MLLFMSVAITSVMVTVDGGQLAYNFRDGYSRVAEWLSSSVDLPAALPSFFRQTPAAATATAAIWLMCVAAGWAGLGRLTRNRRDLALRVLVTVAIVAMIASTLAWRVRGAQGATAELSQIELLQQFDPRWRPHGVDLTHLRSVTIEQIEAQVSISTPLSRPPAADGTLLLVPGVLPAGTYVLEAPNAPLTGTANLVIGRNARPIASWTLNDVRDNRAQFDLPVNVGSIVVLGDQHGIRAPLSVRPIRITPPAARPTQDYARRADRFGPGIVYFFDDGAFVESAGFWVRAAAGTRIATAAMNRDVVAKLFLRNAAVPNHVTLKYDGHTQALDLAPREEKLLSDVVPPAGAVLIDIASDSGFRPSDVEPGSTDTRYLGVWVELRQ